MRLNRANNGGIQTGDRGNAVIGVTQGVSVMAATKPRPDNVPEENVYNGVHWLVILTYIAAIGGVAALMMNAGLRRTLQRIDPSRGDLLHVTHGTALPRPSPRACKSNTRRGADRKPDASSQRVEPDMRRPC